MRNTNLSSDRGDIVEKIFREYNKALKIKGTVEIDISNLAAEVERKNLEDEPEQENVF
ncbi:hypothetical protein KBJ98_15105 [Flavobacterium sp. F-328]|uniref:Uncharacterized protein n=1 Tax=Flavobacterium erciyesense TaxID=2825842 RepID=A0ABS5D7N1_9FLAO|nr:hypothetical protein [Flavobacterium erciyesense]MBQ0910039.1 hypothetical protein [Flavobacterium erciyesense]